MKRKLGVCEWCLPVSGPGLFKQLKKSGFDEFQLDTGTFEAGIPMIFPQVQESYLKAAEEAGIELCSASNMSLCDYGMSQPRNSSHYDACQEIIRKSVDAMEKMKISLLMVPSFFDGEIKDEDSFQNTAAMLKWASDYAADKGVIISWENGLTVEENLKMIELVDRKNFGIGFDVQCPHAFNGYYVPEMIRGLAGHINMLHIKDGFGGDMGICHYGDGDVDFNESVKSLKEIGFTGCVVSENNYNDRNFFKKDGSPFKAMEEDVKRFRKAFD